MTSSQVEVSYSNNLFEEVKIQSIQKVQFLSFFPKVCGEIDKLLFWPTQFSFIPKDCEPEFCPLQINLIFIQIRLVDNNYLLEKYQISNIMLMQFHFPSNFFPSNKSRQSVSTSYWLSIFYCLKKIKSKNGSKMKLHDRKGFAINSLKSCVH